MRNKIFVSLALPAMLFTFNSFAQEKTIQNLYFFRNETDTVTREKDYTPGKKGFYIYRNCVYYLILNNKKQVRFRVTDIANDSIYGRPWEYPYDLREHNATGTIAFHPTQLKSIITGGSTFLGIQKSVNLQKYQYVLAPTTSPKKFERRIEARKAGDSLYTNAVELVPTITTFDLIWSTHTVDPAYTRITDSIENLRDREPAPTKVRNVAWYTPSGATQINGLNMGLQTIHIDFHTPVNINGVNLNADILSIFLTVYGMVALGRDNALINMPDTVTLQEQDNKVNGLSVSFGGLVGAVHMNGISINGGIHTSTYMNGLVITGTQNRIESFNGVVIGGIRNKSIKGNGLQVGLINICKHLKGVQIGLWNVNSKRKLPLINWSF